MRILETLSISAEGKDANEDSWVVTDDLVAVIDGAGDYRRRRYMDKSWGRLAAEWLAAGVVELAAADDAHTAMVRLHEMMRVRWSELPEALRHWPTPTASIAIYNHLRREIWRVGDVDFVVGAAMAQTRTTFDQVMAEIRRILHEAGPDLGLAGDIPQDLHTVWHVMHKYQPGIQNRQDLGTHGISVLDARRAPSRVDVVEVPAEATKVVLATDGYPRVFATLAETETFLFRVLREDPALLGDYAQGRPSINGGPWDDRTYVSILV